MNKKELAEYVVAATDGTSCHENDKRIEYILSQFATQGKDYIVEKNFIQFYLDCAITNDSKYNTVKNNLKALGYNKALVL